MVTLSIVVPIYKVEKYIDECINSVLSQSFQDYELILVDDGSPDKCPEICDEYAKNNNRIKVIHKENGGLSDARNAGIKNASGKYILFLDADDFLIKESLKKLYDCIISVGEIDVILCSMLFYDVKSSLYYKKHKPYIETCNKQVSGIDVLVDLIRTKTIVWNAFSSVFRRENLLNNNVYFEKGLIGAEDLDFFIDIILKSSTFYTKNIDICVYRVGREGSITTDLNIKAFYGQLYIRKKWFDYFYILDVDAQSKKVLCSFFSSLFIMKIFALHMFDKREKYELLQFIRNNIYITEYPTNTKYRIIAKIYKVLGFEIGIWIQKLYHKILSKKTI